MMFSFNQMSQIAKEIYITCNRPDISERIYSKPAKYFFEKYDHLQIIANPLLFMGVGDELSRLIPSGINVLAGIEPSRLPILQMLEQRTGLPVVMLRRSRGADGRIDCMQGMPVQGKNVLVVADVYDDDEGECVLQATQFLRSQGADVGHALALLDKGNGAAFRLFNHEVDAWSLFVKADFTNLNPR